MQANSILRNDGEIRGMGGTEGMGGIGGMGRMGRTGGVGEIEGMGEIGDMGGIRRNGRNEIPFFFVKLNCWFCVEFLFPDLEG